MITEPISFKEAEIMIDGRMDQATAMKYKDILAGWSQDARQRAFFSARVADATLLSEIHRRVSAVVNGSMTSKQAVRLLRESLAGPNADALAALGFAPKAEARGMAELASVPRLRLIIEQNARMAQECGHYQQWEAVKDYYPIGVWHCGYAEVHRQEHLARDGKAYEFDHPIWTQSPPGGEFNCHCWRENMTRDGATAKGLVPEPNTSFFQPSSLGFDPSQPFDASSVVPGKSVLPELVQKAKDSECPDDVLVDMNANIADEERQKAESKRKEAIAEIVGKAQKDMAESSNDVAVLLAKQKPDKTDVILEAYARTTKETDGKNIPIGEYLELKKKNESIVRQEMKDDYADAARKIEERVSKLYTEDALRYGKPPKVVFAPDCAKTSLSPDGFELLIGNDIVGNPKELENVINGLDFVGQMKRGQDYRREFAQRQLKEAQILGIDVEEITFVNDLETRERLRKEAIKLTNPNFSKEKFEWSENCQRVVSACEARLRGFNVVAMPRISRYKNIDRWPFDSNWTEFYKGGRINMLDKYGGTVAKTRKATEEEMKKAGEGSHFIIEVYWHEKKAGGHVFNAEVRHGKVMYYDAQTGNNDCSDYWKLVENSQIKLLRIDNLDFNDNIREAARKK